VTYDIDNVKGAFPTFVSKTVTVGVAPASIVPRLIAVVLQLKFALTLIVPVVGIK
jgi:hypothetical protein